MLKARQNVGQCIFICFSVTQSRNSGFKQWLSINVAEIHSISIRGQDVRFGRIPLQLVPGSSSSGSYLCIKIRETPLGRRLRPSPKKFHRPQARDRQTVRKQTILLQTSWGWWGHSLLNVCDLHTDWRLWWMQIKPVYSWIYPKTSVDMHRNLCSYPTGCHNYSTHHILLTYMW